MMRRETPSRAAPVHGYSLNVCKGTIAVLAGRSRRHEGKHRGIAGVASVAGASVAPKLIRRASG